MLLGPFPSNMILGHIVAQCWQIFDTIVAQQYTFSVPNFFCLSAAIHKLSPQNKNVNFKFQPAGHVLKYNKNQLLLNTFIGHKPNAFQPTCWQSSVVKNTNTYIYIWFNKFFFLLTTSVAKEPEGSSPHSQQPATGPCPEPVVSNPHPPSQSP
jgi:hypothetical protein